jgi:U4/U6.U5 tri-snRNP-associated protein 2
LHLDVDAAPSNSSTLYDLIANVTHESVAGTTRDKENTVWKALLRAAGGGESEKWFMIQDLIVEDTRKEMIFLGETVLQVRMLTSLQEQYSLIPPFVDMGKESK